MKKLFYLFFFSTCVILNSCNNKDNLKLPDISVSFSADELGIDEDEISADVTVSLSRAAESDIEVTIGVATDKVVYGADFTISPAVAGNNIKVSIPAGSTSALIAVSKVEEVAFEGTEKVNLTIVSLSVTEGFVIGEQQEAVVTFGGIVSEGQNPLRLEGKGETENYASSVYVDLSSNKQIPIDRKSWNLGFYSGDDFRVVLNGAYETVATASNKMDITTVTLADAEAAINLAATTQATTGNLPAEVIDGFEGTLAGTVFGEVSANDAENKVYFVVSASMEQIVYGNPGYVRNPDRSQWYKVKVTRNGEGYKVQYAKVGDNNTAIKTVDISKTPGYNFTFFSLETGKTVLVEPGSKKWDIVWTYNVGFTSMMGGRPYYMQDLILVNNLGGVEIAEVLTEPVSYENFNSTALASLPQTAFSNKRNAIADKWRSTSTGVYADRYYIIKDPNGNYYKLQFLKIGVASDGGERGRPEIAYQLIK
ncbi:hypothetical protein EZS27_008260 [termite gut metagenome]|uniref:HmuY protein n=1 Tax=termite gut metagenome TaxID=433724 RepID=A0A5J4SFD7_9ZZZZ